jgi:hypothetical protein
LLPGEVFAWWNSAWRLRRKLTFNNSAQAALGVAAEGGGARGDRELLAVGAEPRRPGHQYHRALMTELTSGAHRRLGDAILAAQGRYARTGLMTELVSVYHLLGDPATTIR